MTSILAFSLVGFLALVAVLWYLLAEREFTRAPEDLVVLDGEAFARVLDDSDEPLIKQMLAPRIYRVARRKRIKAALAYTRRARANAAVLIGIGERLRKSALQVEAIEGERLIRVAAQLRTATAAGLWRFYLALVFPSLPLRHQSIIPSWNELHGLDAEVLVAARHTVVDRK